MRAGIHLSPAKNARSLEHNHAFARKTWISLESNDSLDVILQHLSGASINPIWHDGDLFPSSGASHCQSSSSKIHGKPLAAPEPFWLENVGFSDDWAARFCALSHLVTASLLMVVTSKIINTLGPSKLGFVGWPACSA